MAPIDILKAIKEDIKDKFEADPLMMRTANLMITEFEARTERLHKHDVVRSLPTDKEIRAAATDSTMHQTKTDRWAIDNFQIFFEKGARWAITKLSGQ